MRNSVMASAMAVLLTVLVVNGAMATHLINWPVNGSYLGPPDRGSFGWTNLDATYLRWDGRLWWSTSNGQIDRLRQSYAQNFDPTMEYEGYNPGMQADCDNLNVAGVSTHLPRIGAPEKKTGDCPGDNSAIVEQVDIHINGENFPNAVQGDTIYNQYITYSKTYLSDYDPSWREVNLSYEELVGAMELNLGKVKYDIQGTANGYPTNGRYQATCANPSGAIDNLPYCP